MLFPFNKTQGVTVTEIVVVIAILSALVAAFGSLQSDTFFLSRVFNQGLTASYGATKVLKDIAGIIRTSEPSALGAYPIEQAATSTLTFYADVDADGVTERIRYFIASSTLYKGVIKPSGNPLAYNPASETLSSLITNVMNGTSTALFLYYDKNYDGTSAALPIPVSIANIRLIKVSVVIDPNSAQPLKAMTITTQATLRNLKDNL